MRSDNKATVKIVYRIIRIFDDDSRKLKVDSLTFLIYDSLRKSFAREQIFLNSTRVNFWTYYNTHIKQYEIETDREFESTR